MESLRLTFLGGFKAERDGEPVKAFVSDKARLLLAYLAVEADRMHRRESLAGLFWPEKPETQALHSLRQALSILKKRLQSQEGKPYLEITRQEVVFLGENAWLDVREFEKLVLACEQHAHGSVPVCSACLDRLERAVTLYKGDFLSGISLSGCQELEDWQLLKQEYFHQKMISALSWCSRGFDAQGDFEKALYYARWQIGLDHLDENAHRQVMHVLAQMGQPAEALSQYAACEQILKNELDVTPDFETLALYQRIRRLVEKEPGSAASPHNLPAPLMPMVGRQVELRQLRQKLLDPDCRLITVLGPGGAGKTCLALEAGRSVMTSFPEGVFLAELDAQQSTQTLLPAIAHAVGLDFWPGSNRQSGKTVDLLDQLSVYLQDRRLLLILDGFEGLIHEAYLIVKLLQALPVLKIMVTSRLRLNLACEQIFLLQGLSFPPQLPPEELISYSATQLFIEAARRTDPEFKLNDSNQGAVAELCRLNQGMPLGILLSAAWVPSLSPDRIVQELRRSPDFLSVDWHDLPDRQRSLRATFDHSWHLLKPEGRLIFMRLAIFCGGFTAQRARQVANATFNDLKSLVEHSLVQRVEADRFRIHSLVRQYALEKLSANSDEHMAVHRLYCQAFLESLAQCEKRLKSAEQPEVMREIDQEYADILSAWDWALTQREIHLLENALETLRYYHQLSGFDLEYTEIYQRAMETLEVQGNPTDNLRLWIRLGIWLANSLCRLGEYERAHQLIALIEGRLKEHAEKTNSLRREKALLHLCKGDVIILSGNNRLPALKEYQLGLELMEAGEDAWDISLALLRNATFHGQVGNILESGCYTEQALAIQRSLGDPDLIAGILSNLGFFYMLTGDHAGGLRVAEEHGSYLMRNNNRFNQLIHREYMALAVFYAGKFEKAREMYQEEIKLSTHPIAKGHRLFSQYILESIDLQLGNYEAVLTDAAFTGEKISLYYQNALDLFRAEARLISSDWEWAELELKNYYEMVISLPRYDMAGQPLAMLGYIAYRRGNIAGAQEYLKQALVNGLEKGFYWVFMLALSVLALMHAEAGELEQAIELYATVTAQPCAANSKWFEDLFGRRVKELSSGLPVEIATASRERGCRRKLREVGEEYLRRLTERKI